MVNKVVRHVAQKKSVMVWGLLAGIFLLQGLYYVYLISLPSGQTFELDLDKLYGFATFGFPLAALCISILTLKIDARLSTPSATGIALLMFSLGTGLLLIGGYAVYNGRVGSEAIMSLKSLVLSFTGFVAYPACVVWLAWRYYSRGDVLTSSVAQVAPFFICLGLHVLQFALMVVWPFGEVFRFGGAALALLFSAVNFYNLRTLA